MRPEDPADSDKMSVGVLCSMRLGGYDYPIRRLRSGSDGCNVTLPLQVRNFLAIEWGDWLMFGVTSWPGLAAFFRVKAGRYQALPADERKEFRRMSRKVQGKKGGLFVKISPAVCEILSAEAGDSLIFGIAPGRATVTIAAIKGGGDSAGSRRPG
ncbi:hypothetical protein ES703_34153 [subsurface metagenome]